MVNKIRDIGIIVFTVIITFSVGYLKPLHNMDMVGYVASAFHMDGLKGQELSEQTFADIENEVGSDTFDTLTADGGYRSELYQNNRALEQHLPFYTPRVLYLESMRVLGDFGLSYSKSSYLISSFFAAASVLIIAVLLKQLNVSVYFLPFIVIFSGLITLARLSSPDAMACFFSLSALSLLIGRNMSYLIIAAVLPLIRTDFLILSLLLVIYSYLSGSKVLGIISALVAIISYLLINKVMGNYGWLTIFNFTFINTDPYPAEMVISSDWLNYIKPYVKVAITFMTHPHGIIYLVVIVLWVHLRKQVSSLNFIEHPSIIISLSFVVLHVLAFPAYWDRFFVFAAVIGLVFIFQRLGKDKNHP
jgi:hypothetical protein